jgi:uncharacterized peroxidase-related enzyme
MPFIRTIPADAAEGELRQIYRAIDTARGGIADVHQVQSLNPRALAAHLELYKAVVFQRSTLSRAQRERIAVAVSAANQCAYCVAHHAEALRQLGEPAEQVAALSRGEKPSKLPHADAVLLDWARVAAAAPWSCGESDVAQLRTFGFDDRAVLDAALTVAYFSFVNRLVLLLGVKVENGFEATCRPALQEDR